MTDIEVVRGEIQPWTDYTGYRAPAGGAALLASLRAANTAAEALAQAERAAIPLASLVADAAQRTASEVLGGAPVAVDVLVVDRAGGILAETAHG